METSADKQWASKYLLDPLTAPDPSDETGPGTHYRSTFDPETRSQRSGISSTPKKNSSVHVRHSSYPSPPASASPRRDQFPHRQKAFTDHIESSSQRKNLDRPSSEFPTSAVSTNSTYSRQRGNSLSSRFSGDQSHRPLEMIKKETKIANRAPHLRKAHIIGPDTVDRLDTVGGNYHHDGPFDATLLARNMSFKNSPVEAVSGSTEETLKATPREKVIDSIERHRPLDGVANVPSGMTDRQGRKFNYEEGANMMIENGGNYKRWPGVNYLPEDVKGKGEPSYSIEKALKDHKKHRRGMSDADSGIEMTPRPQSSDGKVRPVSNSQSYSEWEGNMRQSNTTERKGSSAITKRLGKIRGRTNSDE